jgi:hypothetical protein
VPDPDRKTAVPFCGWSQRSGKIPATGAGRQENPRAAVVRALCLSAWIASRWYARHVLPEERRRERSGSRCLVAPTPVSFPSRLDRAPVPSTLMLPKNLDPSRKHPATVWIHGSGSDQNLLGWHPGSYRMYYSVSQLRRLRRAVAKHEKLLRRQRGLRVGPALVVRELHYASAAEQLHNGAHLAPTQPRDGRSASRATTSSRRGGVFIVASTSRSTWSASACARRAAQSTCSQPSQCPPGPALETLARLRLGPTSMWLCLARGSVSLPRHPTPTRAVRASGAPVRRGVENLTHSVGILGSQVF